MLRWSGLGFFGGLPLLFEEVEARLTHAVPLLAAFDLLDGGLALRLVDEPHRPYPLQLGSLLALFSLHSHALRLLAVLWSALRDLAGLGPADLQRQEVLLHEVGVLAEALAVEARVGGEEGVGEVLA